MSSREVVKLKYCLRGQHKEMLGIAEAWGPLCATGFGKKRKKDDTKEIIMVLLHLRRVSLSLYVIPKWSSRELEGP